MSYVLTFIAGGFIGGMVGIFTMCAMIAAGQADDREAWFDERSRKGNGKRTGTRTGDERGEDERIV